jgi:hypothetical protein
VGLPGIVHVEAHLLNDVGDVGACECQPLEGTSEAPVIRGPSAASFGLICTGVEDGLHSAIPARSIISSMYWR